MNDHLIHPEKIPEARMFSELLQCALSSLRLSEWMNELNDEFGFGTFNIFSQNVNNNVIPENLRHIFHFLKVVVKFRKNIINIEYTKDNFSEKIIV